MSFLRAIGCGSHGVWFGLKATPSRSRFRTTTAGIHVQEPKTPSSHATFHAPPYFFTSFPGASSGLCKRPGFLPCAAGYRGGGKVGILGLDFHFSTAQQRNSWFGCSAFKFRKEFCLEPRDFRPARANSALAPSPGTADTFSDPFLSAYASASCGTRSPSRIANRCKAAFQFCTGMVHFWAICSSARNSSFIAASAFGNDPRVLITLRSDMFSDSTAFVV